MKLSNIITEPWAILPDELIEMRQIYETHMKGEKIKFADEASLKEALFLNPNGDFNRNGNVAIIDIKGVIVKQASIIDALLFDTISSYDIRKQFINAVNDSEIDAILLMIDSPGGMVDGTQEFANLIFESRDKKPILAFSDGRMASAAYWIGAAAHSLYVSSNNVKVGSIGVIMSHVDFSKMDEQMGIKETEIYAGKYKNVGSPNKALSDEDRKVLQSMVDYTYTNFINDVAKFRGVSVEKALEMADGKIFIGKQSIEAGLVDGEFTEQGLIDYIGQNVLDLTFSGRASGNDIKTKGETEMDKIQIKEKYPDVYKAIIDEGKETANSERQKDIDNAKLQAAQDERERIKSVMNELFVNGKVMPGMEKQAEELLFDGKSKDGDAAKAVNAHNKAVLSQNLDALNKDKTEPAPSVDGMDAEAKAKQAAKEEKSKDFMSMVDEYMEANDCSKGKAIAAVARKNPEVHQAYLDKINNKSGGEK